MDEVEELRLLLQMYGIDDSMYDDNELQMWISQARSFVGNEFVQETEYEDYQRDFNSDMYMTRAYPISVSSVHVLVDDEGVIPMKITSNGVIYFNNRQHGAISVTYSVEYTEEDVKNVILPVAMYMIRDKNGGNMSSITEGDVSVSYDNINDKLSTSNSIQQLINNLRMKYKARVRLL